MSLEKIKKQYLKYKLGFYYFFSNLFSRRPYLNDKSRVQVNAPITVCLTSFPPRISKLYLVIESLIDQSVYGYEVEVWLSRLEFPGERLPASLRRLEAIGVKFKFVDENIKSYKKLYYAYKSDSSRIYVTADDDAFYPHWWLEKLLEKHNEYPEAVVCYRSKRMTFDQGFLKPYKSWSDDDLLSSRPSLDNFPTGVSGILYPPNTFCKEFLNKKLFMDLAPNADDVWFKISAVRNDRPCIRVFDKSIGFPKVSGSQKVSLHKINNKKGQNDIQLKNVFEYFRLTEQDFKD